MQTLLRNLLLGGGGGFSPQSLFTGGVVGAFYDSSDLSTLYQDSAGTTPVTGVEQVVGLMLDKSQGLVLGSELITPEANRDFSSDTGYWTKETGVTISGGTANWSATANSDLYRLNVLTVGKWYRITWTISSYTSGNFRLSVGGTTGVIRTAAGTYTETYYAASNGTFAITGQSSATGSVDNISVRELPGNHATSTGSARPTLSARVNLLTYSEDFSNAAWLTFGGASKISANAIRLTSADTASNVYQQFTAAETNASSYVFSVEVKRNAATNQTFQLFQNIRGVTPFGRSGDLVATDEWQRFTLTHTAAGGAVGSVFGIIGNTAGTQADLLVRNADLRPTNIGVNIPSYQRIAAATNYDTNGFPFYLSFGGAQSMSTPANLDLTSTDKVTVYAGVRKLTAGTQQLVELSSAVSTNNGSFSMPSDSGTGTWGTASKGTAASVFLAESATNSYVAPVTTANTGLHDLSLATGIARLRVNGSQVAATSAGTAGGNFGTYPFYIGARNNSSLFFTGYLYSLIIQGAAASATQLASTEAWVNQKTKAY